MSRILIVERDAVFGAVLEDRLHVAGHEVELLLDRGRTLEAAGEEPADLLILDLGPPGQDGLELVGAIKEDAGTRTLPILALSESNKGSDRVAALRAGADDFLTLPCDLEELLLRAERLAVSGASRTPMLRGDLVNYPPWELVQYLQQADKSGELTLRGSRVNSRVHFRGGDIVDAKWGGLPSPEALLAIFGLKKGRFQFVAGESGTEPELDPLSSHELIMQAAWLEDELAKRSDELPRSGAPLVTTGGPLPELEDASAFAELPVAEIHRRLQAEPRKRTYDLINDLPLAPQKTRLAIAWLIEHDLVAVPSDAIFESFATTGELDSTQVLDMAVAEFIAAARRAGFGTTALPFLVLAEPGVWPNLLDVLRRVPGFDRDPKLSAFVDKLESRRAGSISFSSEFGKLSLHVQTLESSLRSQTEAILTVCAGVLLWLDEAADEDLIAAILSRFDKARRSVSGVAVAVRPEVLDRVRGWTSKTRRWHPLSHEPRSLLGIFRLLRPQEAVRR